MRWRLRKFLPIVLIALTVQIFAPIAACWAASMAASDPLHAAVICHDNAASSSGQTDQSGQPRAHDGCCSICSVAHAGAPVATPLDWKEVKHGLDPADFRIDNAIERFQRVGDLFAPVIQGGQKLESALEQLQPAEAEKPVRKTAKRAKPDKG